MPPLSRTAHHDGSDVERKDVDELLNRRTDEILLSPSPSAIDRALPFLDSTGAPTVLIDRLVDVDLHGLFSGPSRPSAVARRWPE